MMQQLLVLLRYGVPPGTWYTRIYNNSEKKRRFANCLEPLTRTPTLRTLSGRVFFFFPFLTPLPGADQASHRRGRGPGGD